MSWFSCDVWFGVDDFAATEVRGVSVTQLDSIDPTLVVYRAEATFVGIGIWDLYGAIVTPGARAQWDRQYDDALLLEDVNELSELWHFKQKPVWPAKYVLTISQVTRTQIASSVEGMQYC